MKHGTTINGNANGAYVPPSDVFAEKALLGSILLDGPAVLDDVSPIVGPDDFYLASSADIYRAMLELRERGEPLDTVVIHESVRKSIDSALRGGVTEELLIETMESVPHSGHAIYYARIIAQKSHRRRYQHRLADAMIQARDESLELPDAIAGTVGDLQAIEESGMASRTLSGSDLAHDFIRSLEAGSQPGLATGFCDLDSLLIGGLKPGQLVILAARPSVGKTALAANMMLNVAESGSPVLFLSLEQTPAEITDRLVVSITRASTDIITAVRSGKASEAQRDACVQAAAHIARLSLFIEDRDSLCSLDISTLGRIQRRKNRIGLILVDYLALILPADPRILREQQVAQITRSLKSLARELKLPIIALHQLNRDVEKRGGKPRLSDLRESGAIEQDADIVMFIHRPGKDDDSAEDSTAASLIVAKQRNGPTGELPLYWHAASMTFCNAAPARLQNPFASNEF